MWKNAAKWVDEGRDLANAGRTWAGFSRYLIQTDEKFPRMLGTILRKVKDADLDEIGEYVGNPYRYGLRPNNNAKIMELMGDMSPGDFVRGSPIRAHHANERHFIRGLSVMTMPARAALSEWIKLNPDLAKYIYRGIIAVGGGLATGAVGTAAYYIAKAVEEKRREQQQHEQNERNRLAYQQRTQTKPTVTFGNKPFQRKYNQVNALLGEQASFKWYPNHWLYKDSPFYAWDPSYIPDQDRYGRIPIPKGAYGPANKPKQKINHRRYGNRNRNQKKVKCRDC